MPRVTVPAAEALIGKELPCLNKGYVMLVDYMGGDLSVVQGARVSYAQDFGTFDVVKDKALINYLMAHRHTTPFEQVQIKVEMKLPIFVARQWVRHRTASLNEQSGRYTQLESDFYVPELDDIQAQSKDNKQGRAEDGSFTLSDKERFQANLRSEQSQAYSLYDERIEVGMAKELARINLPLSIYTRWVWSQNLWNMLHLLGLRMDSHAQKEIRVYANALYEVVKAVAPVSLAAWEEFIYKGARFSQTEMALLCKGLNNVRDPYGLLGRVDWSTEELEAALGKRGAQEFLDKVRAEYHAGGVGEDC